MYCSLNGHVKGIQELDGRSITGIFTSYSNLHGLGSLCMDNTGSPIFYIIQKNKTEMWDFFYSVFDLLNIHLFHDASNLQAIETVSLHTCIVFKSIDVP